MEKGGIGGIDIPCRIKNDWEEILGGRQSEEKVDRGRDREG